MPKHMTPQERVECLALYAQGDTLDALSERYQRERNTIIRLIRRSNAKRGHKFRARRPSKIPFAGKEA